VRAVNLIPSEQRERQAGLANRSQGVAYVVLGVGAVVALLAFLYGRAHRQVSAKESEAAKLEAKARSVQQQATSLAPYKTFIALRESRETAIATLVNSRFDWAHTVGDLGRLLPPKTTIVSFAGSVGGTGGPGSAAKSSSSGTIGSATPAGAVPTLTLSGCAQSQSMVALTLTRLRLIDGVSNVELHSSSKSSSAASSGGGAAAGACPASYPTFNVTVTFNPLPSPPTSAGTAARPAGTGGSSAGARAQAAASGSTGVKPR
jgi:Tfp pilus assembly protein PilN